MPFFEKERLNILRISADVIVPIPLRPRRERERGFNQANFIARELSHVLELPVDTNLRPDCGRRW